MLAWKKVTQYQRRIRLESGMMKFGCADRFTICPNPKVTRQWSVSRADRFLRWAGGTQAYFQAIPGVEFGAIDGTGATGSKRSARAIHHLA
jgi:hypothetical protein